MLVAKKKNGRLVLVRKKFESITIYDKNDGAFVPIIVEVASINGNRVSLSVVAPENIGIVRSEIAGRKTNAATHAIAGVDSAPSETKNEGA